MEFLLLQNLSTLTESFIITVLSISFGLLLQPKNIKNIKIVILIFIVNQLPSGFCFGYFLGSDT